MCDIPTGIATPYSANRPRIWFVSAVLALTNPWQARWDTQNRLLLDILDQHETHVLATYRLADHFGISHVIFVRLHIRSHELWCHQLHGMPQLLQLPGPVVVAHARRHPDQAWLQLGEEFHHLNALELFPEHRITMRNDSMDLDYPFCQIGANCCNLHLGYTLRNVVELTSPLWHLNAISERGRPFHYYTSWNDQYNSHCRRFTSSQNHH